MDNGLAHVDGCMKGRIGSYACGRSRQVQVP